MRPTAPPPEPAAEPRSLERSAAWLVSGLGGFALIGAAIFLFRYAVSQGWLGPGIRFAGGLVAGIAGLAAAEALFRRAYRAPANGLAGAAIATLFAVTFAAHGKWSLIGTGPAFALMVATAAAGVWVAVRHDAQLVAVLGLCGAFATPVLLSTGEDRTVSLFAYLVLVNGGLAFAATRRGWWLLPLLAGAASLLVHLGWGAKFHDADHAVAALLAGMVLASVWLAVAAIAEDEHLAHAAAFAGLAIPLATLPFLAPFSGARAGVAAPALSALMLALLSGATQELAALRGWAPMSLLAAGASFPGLVTVVWSWARLHDGAPTVWLAVAVLGVPTAAVVPWLFRAHRDPPGPLASLVGALIALLVACGELGSGLSTGLLLALAAIGLVLSARPGPGGSFAAANIVGAVLLTIVADRATGGSVLFAAVALAMLGTVAPVLMAGWGRPDLRSSPLSTLGAACAPLLMLPSLLACWRELGYADSSGAPAAILAAIAFAATWLSARPDSETLPAPSAFAAIGILLLAMAVPLQWDREAVAIGWAMLALTLAVATTFVRAPQLGLASVLLLGAATLDVALNPAALSWYRATGPTLFSWPLYGFGVPIGAGLVIGRLLRDQEGGATLSKVGAALTIILSFSFVNFEVSSAFAEAGESLRLVGRSLTERMTRSIAWAGYGALLLAIGFGSARAWLRGVALGFLVLAAGKVFLVDLWSLTGLVRVGSLLGLAVVLIVAGVAYQRLVLRERP
jgi:uncharacterized membrane protein